MYGMKTYAPAGFDELGLETPFASGEQPDERLALDALGETPFVGETAGSAAVRAGTRNRILVDRHPMLRGHRGAAPDLILLWNDINRSGDVDVVVHFHGYAVIKGMRSNFDKMRLDFHKEPISGLDFTDPDGPGSPGRSRPTLAILPRGNHAPTDKRSDAYNFPDLVGKGALDKLIQDALARASRETGHALSRGRLILTGHSGGGAAVSAILTHTDPDEVHIFDGMYGSCANFVRWARRRIARELAAPGTVPPALRILYRPGSKKYPGTQPHSEAVARALCRTLAPAPAVRLRPYFRVDRTSVDHNSIPRRFGWQLLADPSAAVPGATTFACRPLGRRKTAAEHNEGPDSEDLATPDFENLDAEAEWLEIDDRRGRMG